MDTELLLAEALQQPRGYLYAWPERSCPDAVAQRFQHSLARRRRGEPLAYILGRREFWSLALAVAPGVLIPRPETEHLVELALAKIPPRRPAKVADLGTGSGAIALAIATERPRARITATDRSRAALAVAQANARRLALNTIRFCYGSWLSAPGIGRRRFDVIVANPPYIARYSRYLYAPELRREPRQSLTAGADGLDAIRQIIDQAPRHLQRRGWLLLEHGFDQGQAVTRLLRAGGFTRVRSYRDYAGRARVSVGQRPFRPLPWRNTALG